MEMTFDLEKVETPADRNRFIRLPWNIYRDHPCWVPPLIGERKRFLDPKINPFFEEAETDLYLVLDENRTPVGRIAITLNHAYNKFHSERVGFFGLFESVDDRKVSDLLLDKAYAWCHEKNLDKLMGPANLSTNHECGLLVEGFDTPPVIGIPYNLPYYVDLFQQWGLNKAKDLLSLKLDLTGIPAYLESGISRLRKRNRFSVRPFRPNKFDEEIDIMWDVYNSAWTANWGFVPMSQREFVFSAHEMKSFVHPEFCLIAEVKGEPAGFSLTLPDVNQILKHMDGRLFPLGWAKFLWGRNKINNYRVVALGVKNKFRRLGIDAYFNYTTYQKFLAEKVPVCDLSWVLEDNHNILDPIRRIGGTIYKRHRIYERACIS
ncbi:hypothetical protein UR09_02300 [Candidatus Nitromaritima sp. SCGC AAA799-A02]|nr:hypothetical protein UR09_02300 [Candidatus Nitromaritima sp. SCGC AAA799-A02]